MNIIRNLQVPTGNTMVVEGAHGNLECLSIGDYGQSANIKADFLGLSRPITHVEHQEMLPLEDKWVITISTQYGCSMNCKFCDVPKVGLGLNATYKDMIGQIVCGLEQHPEVKFTNRLNLHYARMGEPTWNPAVLETAMSLHKELAPYIGGSHIHPVISTMMPRYNRGLKNFIHTWAFIKNEVYGGEAGLQFSINSTSEGERVDMFSGNAMSLEDIAALGRELPDPKGRKYTLNFAVADYEVHARRLRMLFDPDKFMVKLTPMHKTDAALAHGIKTEGDYTSIYPYEHIEEELKRVGFDVLVFLASEYEDLGRITCGNAILSGALPDCPFKEI